MIQNNDLVTVEYQLFVKNEDGSMELMEATTNDNPLRYFHGVGTMLPAFEREMEGKSAGDEFEFSIPCAEAYGEHTEDNLLDLPMSVFSSDGKLDEEKFFVGAIVPLVDSDGQRINAEIMEIGKDYIKVDLNHPLAGEDLYFKGKILDAHQPTEEEIQALNSSSCGCGGGCSCGSHEEEHGCGCGGGCCC